MSSIKLPDAPDKWDRLWMQRYTQTIVNFLGQFTHDSNASRVDLVSVTLAAPPSTLQYTNKGATLLNVFIKDFGSGSATYTTGSTTVAWFVNPAATTAYYTITLGRGDTFSYSYIAPLPAVQIVPIQ